MYLGPHKKIHYEVRGYSRGPAPENKWGIRQKREFSYNVLANNITDAIDLVDQEERRRKFEEDVSTSHSCYIYHDAEEVIITSIHVVGDPIELVTDFLEL